MLNESRRDKAYWRQHYLDMCNKLGIEYPANAKSKTLKDLIDDYKSEAVVVETSEGIQLRRTNESVQDFCYSVTFNYSVEVKATSEEAAREWVEEQFENLTCDLNSGMSIYSYDLMECELIADEDEV